MSKFKVGDRVVCIGEWNYGATATVMEPEKYTEPHEVLIKCDKRIKKANIYITHTYGHELEFEDIWNSPLYKALS